MHRPSGLAHVRACSAASAPIADGCGEATLSPGARRSVCYVAPGHALVASAGPTRNVLNLARALSRWADVTVAFQRVVDAEVPDDIRIVEIEPNARARAMRGDAAAMRAVGYAEFLRYLQTLRRFAAQQLLSYDIVLEKSWLLSGYVSSLCRRRGVVGVPVENLVPNLGHVARRNLSKFARLQVGRWLAGHYLRRSPLVIAETEFLKTDITTHWRVAPERIEVVDLGVDRGLFRPLDQVAARRSIGIGLDQAILMYVGALDDIHDLGPLLEAMKAEPDPALELHLVGDGHFRNRYQAKAEGARNVVFHGRVPHRRVPEFIAAADLCLAPYDTGVFAARSLGYATMKIPEYLSCGRPVASVPSGRIPGLVQEGVSGFLFPNDVLNWRRFLSERPSRERLRRMGEAAAQVCLNSWEDTARAYLTLCERQLTCSAAART